MEFQKNHKKQPRPYARGNNACEVVPAFLVLLAVAAVSVSAYVSGTFSDASGDGTSGASSEASSDVWTAVSVEYGCRIVRVDDGDTADFSCETSEGRERVFKNVRLAGVNAPDDHAGESRKCFFKEAKERVLDAMDEADGTPALYSLEIVGKDLCKDERNGCRPVAFVRPYLWESTLNETLVSEGYAFAWTNPEFGLPEAESLRLEASMASAEAGGRGLWGACRIARNPEDLRKGKDGQSVPPLMTSDELSK